MPGSQRFVTLCKRTEINQRNVHIEFMGDCVWYSLYEFSFCECCLYICDWVYDEDWNELERCVDDQLKLTDYLIVDNTHAGGGGK